MPRIPRWELHAHPSVVLVLRNTISPAAPPFYTNADHLSLTGIPIIEHEDYPKGMYRLYKDGAIHDFGFITTPEESS